MITLNKENVLKQVNEKLSRKVLSYGGSLLMVETHFKKGGIGELHSHKDHEQISYVVKGSLEVEVDGQRKVLQAGDSFYANRNVIHGVAILEDTLVLDVFAPIREEIL